jgi:glycosyltransferase involved in cell wall biosynthesis
MKLLCVIDSLSSGGAQRQIVNVAVQLRQRNHEVDIFCYAPGDLLARPVKDAGIPILRHRKSSRYSADVIFQLRSNIRDKKYDSVLSFLETPNCYALLAARSLSNRPRVVVSERGFGNPDARLNVKSALMRRLYALADHVVVNSHHQRESISAECFWLRGRISTIYNGVDIDTFTHARREPNGPLKLLVVGSVSPHKNGLCLILALARLRLVSNLRPVVTWVGEHVATIASRRRYSELMKRQIEAFGLGDQWIWRAPTDKIVDMFHGHDVLVHPSYAEGLPNVVCEALACGRPVIVSDTLDHPRLVRDGETGFLFDWRRPEHLAEVIARFAGLSPERRREMGGCARLAAEEMFSMRRLAAEYEQVLMVTRE